jgi:RHS repeat-associated protein
MLTASGFPGNDCPPDLDLSAITAQSVIAGQAITLNLPALGATLSDLRTDGTPSGDVLRWLADPDTGIDFPAGATLTSAGVFSWTPTAAQVGQHIVTIIGVDSGSPALADAETFSIAVVTSTDPVPVVDLNGANTGADFAAAFTEDGPAVAIVGSGLTVIDADSANLTGATVTLTARPDAAAESLAATTAGTPITASYDPATGILSLTGAASATQYEQVLRTLTYANSSQNPNTAGRTVTVVVTDGVNTSVARTSTVSVTAVNDAPLMTAITNQNVVIGDELVRVVTASDVENDTLTFTLDPDNSPLGATITKTSATTAEVRWTSQAVTFPGSVGFRVLVTDAGNPQLSDAESFTVTVHEVNLSPNLAAIPDQTATVGQQLVVTVAATDTNNGQTLTFLLDPDNSPATATITKITPTTAEVRWTPTVADAPGPANFGVLVTDNGFLPLFDSETFSVSVSGTAPAGLIVESNRFVTQREEVVPLAPTTGKRTLSFDLELFFDTSDQGPFVDDALNVYLFDAANPTIELLNGGAPGVPVFSASPSGAEFLPGLVRFDGTTVEIDVSSVSGVAEALVRYQLLSGDSDTGTSAKIEPIIAAFDDTMTSGPVLALTMASTAPGQAVDLASYNVTTSIDVVPEHVRYDAATGKYAVNLRLQNQGPAVGRNLALVFTGLPAAVQVTNASGVDGSGNPYVNFSPAVSGGGLASGAASAAIELLIDNPQAVRFSLIGNVLVGPANRAPQFLAIPPVALVPGDHYEMLLDVDDPDGDPLTFSLNAPNGLPNGMVMQNGTLIFTPAPGQEGTYAFDVVASDGVLTSMQSSTVTIQADPVTTTRISGVVLGTTGQPLAGIGITLGSLSTTTAADGSFELAATGAIPSDTLDIHGETFVGTETYPFVAEKLPLLLGRDVYLNAKNAIGRPIYLPALDMANAVQIDPNVNTVVTTAAIPGAAVMVNAGTLMNQQGQPFTGMLGITQVPTALTPAALPKNMRPDLVVTIQPGDMVFAQPAPMTFPNSAGYAPGTLLDLWSINPNTGQFDDVGDMRVSADGTVIETISGGIRNSSWHFPSPPPDMMNNDDDGNEDDDCDECKVKGPKTNSEVELHSGAYLEDHSLVTYQSLGQTRGFGLHYDSLRADARPILFFGYSNVNPGVSRRILATLEVERGNFMYQVPGYMGTEFGLQGGEHIWSVPTTAGPVRGALQIDLRDAPTGVYNYDLTTGIVNFNGTTFAGSTQTATKELHFVNFVDSPFGSGWGLTGLERIHDNPDGSLLVVDGGGSELYFAPPTTAGGAYVSPPGDFSTLVKLGDGSYRRTMTDQSVYLYRTDGRIASMTDRVGNSTQFEYDANGLIQRIVDPVGLATVFASSAGRITSITDPANKVTTLEYDAAGNLTKVTDPDGTLRTWSYDDNHHIVGEIDKLGRTETTDYNFAGRVVRNILSDGTEVFYDPVQTQYLKSPTATTNPLAPPVIDRLAPISATYSDSNGNVTEVMLDKQGQALNSRDGQGSLGSVARNADNLVQNAGDSRGFTTNFTYDAIGNVLSITDQVGALTGGSLFVTGHDSDDHSNGAYQRAGLDFVTFGQTASTPDEVAARAQVKVGFLGNSDGSSRGAAASGYTNRTFIDLDNANWADTAFDGTFEILIIGSGGDFVNSTGSTRLNAEAARFADYFNAGGGIYVNTDAGGTSIGQNFYSFLPTFGATRAALGGTGVYTATPEGLLIGLTEPVVDSDPTHTEYQNVDTTIFRVFETHNQTGDAVAIGLFGGFIGGGFGGVARQFFTYDPNFSQPTSYVDGQGNRFLYDVDPANGNRTKSTRVVGNIDSVANGETNDLVSSMSYTTQGLVDTMTDPLGRVTDYDYDARGRLVTVTYAKGTADEAVMRYEYDLAGNQTAMIDGNGNRTEYQYDALNRLVRSIEADPDGAGPLTSPTTNIAYDARGNVASATDARGNTTTSVYDDKDRLVQSTGPDPDGAGPLAAPVTRYVYDLAGNLASSTDPNGNVTQYEYDSRNRRVAMIDPDGGVTRSAYDADNNLARVADPVGNITRFVYDARSRLVEETDPLGKKITYTYDAANNLISKVDRNGRETRYAYDDRNRLVREEWIGANDAIVNTIAYAYDAASNLISAFDAYSALVYTYDALGRVLTVDNRGNEATMGTPNIPRVVLTYAYDDNGNVLSVTDTISGAMGASTSYAYDALDRLVRLTQNGSNTSDKRVDFAYNTLGHYASIDRFSDLAGTQLVTGTDYSYDSQNRLTRLDHKNASNASVAFYDYVYDLASRITQITDVDGVTHYSYDDRDQLTGADHTAAAQTDESYQYDANGNRVSSSLHGRGYVTGSGNRLLTDGTYAYQYDDEGNMIRRTEVASGDYRVFVWDHRNRLTAVNDFRNDNVALKASIYSYDAKDRRVSKSVDADLVDATDAAFAYFVYDNEDVILDFIDTDGPAGSGSAVEVFQRYLHGSRIDEVLAQESLSLGNHWMLTDHLGSIRALARNQGDIAATLTYDSFGNRIAGGPIESRFGYTGREFDSDTGLQYSRARYYSSELGQFISEDPVGFLGHQQNLRGYVGNEPISHADPGGLAGTCSVKGEWVGASISNVNWDYRGVSVAFEPSLWPPNLITVKLMLSASATVDLGLKCVKSCTSCGETTTSEITTSVRVNTPQIALPPIPIPVPKEFYPICAAAAGAAGYFSAGFGAPGVYSACMVSLFAAKATYLVAHYGPRLVAFIENDLVRAAYDTAGDPSKLCRSAS